METDFGLEASRLVKSSSTCGTYLQIGALLLLSAFIVRGRQNSKVNAANRVVLMFIVLFIILRRKVTIIYENNHNIFPKNIQLGPILSKNGSLLCGICGSFQRKSPTFSALFLIFASLLIIRLL
jgi:hypothetical protein